MSSADRADFVRYQEQRRGGLWSLLGDLPTRRLPTSRLLRVERCAGFDLEHLELDLNGVEAVPAILLLPHHRSQRAPGLLYLHAHGDTYQLGKEELLLGRDVMRPYAPDLAARGVVTLAIDSWCFSGRQHDPDGRTGEHDTFKHMLWHGRVLWGMMLFDLAQAFDYLSARPEVDADRVGALGLSMGATQAWWLAALEPRVRVCIDLCCLTDFQELIAARNLRGHGFYYYVPRLLKHFQSHQINELIVARPRLSLNGRHDALTPPAGVERIRDHLLPLYEAAGRRDDCRIELFDCGHEETPAMRQQSLAWLEKHLIAAPA